MLIKPLFCGFFNLTFSIACFSFKFACVNYWLLLFLPIPVIIHLFYFRKAKSIFFSNVRLLQKSISKTKQQTRLKHILVLLSRLAAFIFILLSFFQGFLRRDDQRVDSAIFFIDNSYSQSESIEGIPLLDIGKEVLNGLVDQISGGILLSNDASKRIFSKPSAVLKAEMEELGYSNELLDIGEMLVNSSPSITHRVVVSDFQNAKRSFIEQLSMDSSHRYDLLVNSLPVSRNVYVDSIFSRGYSENYSKLLLTLRVQSTNYEGSVNLKLSNDRRQVYSRILAFSGSEQRNLDLELPLESETEFTVELSGDNVQFDNTFFFTHESIEPLKVAIISERESKSIRSVFSNKLFFRLDEFPANSDYSRLNDFDLIVLDNLTEVPVGLKNLKKPVFLIVPGESIDNESYSRFFGAGITGAEVQHTEEIDFDLNNPFFQNVFESKPSNFTNPGAIGRLQFSGEYSSLIDYRGNNTFLARNENVYILNTTLSEKDSELINHSIFVPLMYRIAFQVRRLISGLYCYPEDFMQFSVSNNEFPIRLANDSFEFYPAYSISDGLVNVKIPGEAVPGYYAVLQGIDTLAAISVNIPKRESLFDGISNEELVRLADQYDNISVTIHEPIEQFGNLATFVPAEPNTWKYLLLLAIAFLLLEAILHRYFK